MRTSNYSVYKSYSTHFSKDQSCDSVTRQRSIYSEKDSKRSKIINSQEAILSTNFNWILYRLFTYIYELIT